MDWTEIENHWDQAIVLLKRQWERLPEARLRETSGDRGKLLALLHEAYGDEPRTLERALSRWQEAAVLNPMHGAPGFTEHILAGTGRPAPAAGRQALARVSRALGEAVRQQPLTALGCAAALGLLLGRALKRRPRAEA
jgi:hypothetical protein